MLFATSVQHNDDNANKLIPGNFSSIRIIKTSFFPVKDPIVITIFEMFHLRHDELGASIEMKAFH